MAVNLYGVTRNMLVTVCDEFAEQARLKAYGNAPYDSGQLCTSIHVVPQGLGRYMVTTAANGINGFPYPARIEAGDMVLPKPGNYKGIWFHGSYHLSARASTRSHFMENTVNSLHI